MFVVGLVLAVPLFAWATNLAVLGAANGKVYTTVESVPSAPVALVLGTSPTYGGQKNLFFLVRLEATAELYKTGRVKKILVSGDNGRTTYDEPSAMRDELVSRGVPAGDIVLDYAGFRTLDSIVRAKEVFCVDKCIIVTDDFHLPRALYIASKTGLDAVGYQTKPVDEFVSRSTREREVKARTMAWIDLNILNRRPKFLGKKEPIFVSK